LIVAGPREYKCYAEITPAPPPPPPVPVEGGRRLLERAVESVSTA